MQHSGRLGLLLPFFQLHTPVICVRGAFWSGHRLHEAMQNSAFVVANFFMPPWSVWALTENSMGKYVSGSCCGKPAESQTV